MARVFKFGLHAEREASENLHGNDIEKVVKNCTVCNKHRPILKDSIDKRCKKPITWENLRWTDSVEKFLKCSLSFPLPDPVALKVSHARTGQQET